MFGLCAAVIIALTLPAQAVEAALEPLEIVTSTGAHQFQVEVARTTRERERGLMDRRSMPRNQGMLFDFHIEQTVTMWMKNTYLPLDMIFVARNGRVTALQQNAVPMSETIIPSGPPAYAVIELNGGVAQEIGLEVGNLVRHPTFKP
jgi:uncharacterized membrane protein (UPF0127 family)